MNFLVYIVLIGIIIFIVHLILSKFKFPKVGALALFDGGVKVGKSACSVKCAVSNYKRNVREWKFKCFLIKFINLFLSKNKKKTLPEKPYFYSNIPIATIPYIPLTDEHLLRKKRIRYKFVVFIDEASLVADSQLIKDKVINIELLLYFKLFGHETKGGLCVYNSHNITDLHYALKRTTSQYFYIHHLTKWIPFFVIAYMREERYSEDGTVINTYDGDVEDSLKKVIMSKKVFKIYDSYAFSYLTDYLPFDEEKDLRLLSTKDCLKPDNLVSFRPELLALPSRLELQRSDEQRRSNNESNN